MSERQLYLNPKQIAIRQAFISGDYKRVVAICGRGMGKSTIMADYLFSCVDTMPRSRGALGSQTDDIIRNRSLSSIQEHWERMGLVEGANDDYVVGLKPPRDWDTPYSKPDKYNNSITFWNGATIDMVSLYKAGGGRGANYQFFAGDEMGLVKRENFGPNIVPAMRGCRFKVAKLEVDTAEEEVPFGWIETEGFRHYWMVPFVENPYYMSMLLVSSMPYLDHGKWLLEYEDDPGTFFIEGTALDNIHVLGPDYVPNQQAILTDLEFRIEIMNERMSQKPDGFYKAFRDEKHVVEHNPYKPDLPLDISFDFGKFMGLVIGQHINGRAYAIDVLYDKKGDLEALVSAFLDRYEKHQDKTLMIWGDAAGNYSRTQEDDKRILYEIIEEMLDAAGWGHLRMFKTENPPHADKHILINRGLDEREGSNLPPLRIYGANCKPLILSIKDAGMDDKLKKDKRTEHPKSAIEAEEATHLSDAFDYWYYEKYQDGYAYSSDGGGVGMDIYIG